eukprot:m.189880 g.189880  ORF g.189880 m.189880 type:complete len:144 (+) comp18218_c0_seq6:1050-1481(+)
MARHVWFFLAFVAVAADMAAAAAAPSLTRVLLSAPTAAAPGGKCLDGTAAGYYIDGNNSDLFAIYLEGGGACYSKETCESRAKTSLGSSKGWPATHGGSGVYRCVSLSVASTQGLWFVPVPREEGCNDHGPTTDRLIRVDASC